MDWANIETWPHAHLSRRVRGPVHEWHIQETGTGDTVLLLHGAGGATHSFRGLIPRLAESHHVVALDLPGHGFTKLGARHRSGLDAMAQDIHALMNQEGWRPTTIIAHSAGAAVALRLGQRLPAPDRNALRIVGINAALEPFKGLAGIMFPAMAKMLALTPFAADLFTGAAKDPERVSALLANTGSEIDEAGHALYRRLVADRAHVQGVLLMMAQWQLEPLLRDLSSIEIETLLLAAEKDTTVLPDVARDAARRLPNARVQTLPDLGHLAHEEDPEQVARIVLTAKSLQTA